MPAPSMVRRPSSTGDDKIKVRGIDDLMVVRARCCNPIRGESIVGYITRGKGVSVHSASCPNVTNLLYDPERRIAVEWDQAKGTGESVYDVRLSVEVEDRPGLLAAITAVLAGMNADIRNAEVRTFDDKTAAVELVLRIQDLKHLDKVVRSVRGVAGVLDVERQAVSR
jgi:GTP pyrophosphokinase